MKTKADRAAYMREWRKRNLQKVRAQQRGRYAKKKREICTKQRERYATDPEYRTKKQNQNRTSRERHREERRESEKLYRQTNREILNEKKREYYLKNRERILGLRKTQNHRDKENARRREVYKISPDRFRTRSRKWRMGNPNKCKEMRQRKTNENRQRRVNARLARFGLLFAVGA